MGSLKEMFHSTGFQTFMKKMLIYALIIFVLGIIFLIISVKTTHLILLVQLPLNLFRSKFRSLKEPLLTRFLLCAIIILQVVTSSIHGIYTIFTGFSAL